MILIPGNMSDLNMTCGATNCHIGITKRVRKSIMNTMQGVIAVNQSVMDYDQETNPMIGMHDQDEHSATGTHSRQLCYSCHLGNPKTEVGPIVELSRGGGCNACHLNYTEEQVVAFEQYKQERNPEEIPSVHPSLTLEVGNDKCFGCHSRSGRISTNYEGWHETLLPQTEVYDEDTLRTLDDGRIFEMVSEDIHHSAGLECIDCHTSRELMGDGILHQHKEEAIHVKCEDCHFKKRPATISYDDLDEESKKLVDLRKFHKADYEFVNSDSTALINVLVNEDGQAILISKNKGKEYELSSPVDQCDRSGGHSRLSCQSCHSAWAPQCLGCHTLNGIQN